MKSWRAIIPVVLVGLSILATNLLPLPAQSEETSGKKALYLFSLDFPPDLTTQYPSPPMQETKFWQLLDQEMQATHNLMLTESMEKADYRVEIRCAGALNCLNVAVDVKDLQRNVLTSFEIKRIHPLLGLWKPDLEKVARELAIRLDDRLKLIEQGGGYGYAD